MLTKKLITNLILASITANAVGCSGLETKVAKTSTKTTEIINDVVRKSEKEVPVVTSTSASWLAGAAIQLADPVLPALQQPVLYHPTKQVSISDVASWITQEKGLVVDTAEVKVPGQSSTQSAVPVAAAGQPVGLFYVNYEGPVSGLLDIVANKTSSWWHVVDGRVSFYQSETKTFYLPAIARKYVGDSTIASTSSSSGTGSSSQASSGANSISTYTIDFWADVEKTAKAVASGAQVSVNSSSSSITVTGTPSQVRHVQEWTRGLADQLSQQVAVSVQIYSVKLKNEDNYNWNPSVLFKPASGLFNINLAGPQSPSVVSGANPLKLGVSIISNAISGRSTQYNGSQLAFQALSTIGNVIENLNQTVVTLNGQPAPIQIANQQGYLASSATTLTPNVGATTTLTPGNITTGFTAMFLPRIVNGKVILGVTMTNSTSNGFTTTTSGGSSISSPNIDVNTFQQSVSLTPGDALMLTGLQRDALSASKSGVGKADNYALGGGVDNSTNKQVVAIVITAKIL